jgi:hypothetical protein
MVEAFYIVPFLPVRADLLPKRNQARQKMATLPVARFKELALEILMAIEVRFPAIASEYNRRNGPLAESESDWGNQGRLAPPPSSAAMMRNISAEKPYGRDRSREPPMKQKNDSYGWDDDHSENSADHSFFNTKNDGRNSGELIEMRANYELKLATMEKKLQLARDELGELQRELQNEKEVLKL